MNSSVRAVLVVWPCKAAVDLIGFKIEFQLPHSTLKKPAKRKLKTILVVKVKAFYLLKLGLYMGFFYLILNVETETKILETYSEQLLLHTSHCLKSSQSSLLFKLTFLILIIF